MSGLPAQRQEHLVKNYLYLAEQNGAVVLPADHGHPDLAARGGGYDVRVKFTKAQPAPAQQVLTAEQVVMAAASLGTQKLLHRMKDEGHLPRLSERLGYLSRTNSESILGAIAPDDPIDYTYGVAITVELPPRRGHPHRAGALRQGLQHDGACCRPCSPTATAPSRAGGPGCRRCGRSAQRRDLYDFKHWSERTVIALVMQSLDNSITTYGKRPPRLC
jgi:cholesterol oxidase